jgi:hypothetical protein
MVKNVFSWHWMGYFDIICFLWDVQATCWQARGWNGDFKPHKLGNRVKTL